MSQKEKFPPKNKMKLLRSRLRRRKPSTGFSAEQVLASQGLVDIAVAAVGAPGPRPILKAMADKVIYVAPTRSGAVVFDVLPYVGVCVSISVRPEDFNLRSPQQKLRFQLYRRLIDIFHRVPLVVEKPGKEPESVKRCGNFEVFCSAKKDGVNWQRVRDRWNAVRLAK